ncbi:Serine/threonine-protein kinase PrkC [Luteitalea pratensis]|uniref:Serine/threonine-protein kinase PrkC n=1 Tax=Luteitalea pratensis TaxID=1855912 RepID=A0A143PNW6_LUTPR|nr:protein kinase [Luteitalea pratensis]AMY09484.1 Serine/threonine-protein kinase PrkC [Luteitalea pratensis]
MTPERWDAVERLYHAALECGLDQRDRFLASACEGDEALRAEVESLLAHGLAASDFLASPPADELRAAIASRLDHRVSAPGQYVGQTFGPYTIVTWLASGGMGDVYRAVDTRLNRTVAVKVLPQQPWCDPERQLRFRREAEIVSNLNHPHICTVHDIGVHDGVDYIVMEYIEGETMQQCLARGSLPLARALEYSVQIVDALDKAHRRGVVHRDLKPGNVMITAAGIKLLDFGIATRMTAPTARLGDAPDPTSHGAIAQEPAMATPRYASPEQLEGKGVDARTDIFSFGATAYEMVTGRAAFEGETRSVVIRSVLQEEPSPIRELAPAVPNAVARTLARCLAKAPDERWQTASDLLFELRSLAADNSLDGGVAMRAAPKSPWRERAWWLAAVAAAVLLPLMFTASRLGSDRATPNAPDLRFDVWPEADTAFAASFDVPFALAPDGRSLAYVAVGADGVRRLWLRRFDGASERAQQIAGAEDANTPFWSPDGAWVGFFSRQRLLKVRVSNARVQIVATHAASMAGATWGADGVILFPTGPGGLSRVSADGGPMSAATTGDGSHFWPQFIGDGRRFLYAAARTNGIRLGSVSGEPSRLLMKVPLRISSLGYTHGYIFFGQDASLFARAFDERTLEVSGEPIELLTGIPITQLGRMPFSISAAGPLAFWRYAGGTPATLQWLIEDGRTEPAIEGPARYVGFDLAPDGRRLAFSRRNVDGGADVWVRDLRTSAETRLTFHGFAFAPRWSPDGRRLAFTAT